MGEGWELEYILKSEAYCNIRHDIHLIGKDSNIITVLKPLLNKSEVIVALQLNTCLICYIIRLGFPKNYMFE